MNERQAQRRLRDLKHEEIGESRLPGGGGVGELAAGAGQHGVLHAAEGDAVTAADMIGRQHPSITDIDTPTDSDRADVIPAGVIGRGRHVA